MHENHAYIRLLGRLHGFGGETPTDVAQASEADTLELLVSRANELQERFRFITDSREDSGTVFLSDAPSASLYTVARETGVTVSYPMCLALGEDTGAGWERVAITAILAGVLQWRSLVLNYRLIPEDFYHRKPRNCVLSAPAVTGEVPKVFAHPELCPACADLYRCVGAELEVLSVSDAFAALNSWADFPAPED